MRKKSTRLLSAALAVCMMLSVLPVGAFAAEPGTEPENTINTQDNQGELLQGSEQITDTMIGSQDCAVYRLQDDYGARAIEIDTKKDVILNITGPVTYDNTIPSAFIIVRKVGKLTINGNGNTVKLSQSCRMVDFKPINNNAELEVNGGSYVDGCGFYIYKKGKAKLNSVTVKAVSYEHAVWANDESHIEIYDGDYAASSGDAIHVGDNAKVDLYGNVNATSNARYAVFNGKQGEVEIHNGCYTSTRNAAVYNEDRGTVEIYDGQFEGDTEKSPYVGYGTALINNNVNAKVKIHGGHFVQKSGSQAGFKASLLNEGTMIIDGPSVKVESEDCAAVKNGSGGVLEIQNGTFKSSGSNCIAAYGGSATLTGGTIEAPNSAAVITDGILTIDGATLQNSKYGVYVTRDGYNATGETKINQVTLVNNGTDIHIGVDKISAGPIEPPKEKDQLVTIGEGFTGSATVECSNPSDGRKITTATQSNYQENLDLISANPEYTVAYCKGDDGKEYRYLKQRNSFTVTAFHATAEAVLSGGGPEKLEPTTQVTPGTVVSLKADENKKFISWTVKLNGVEKDDLKNFLTTPDENDPTKVTFIMPKADVEVTANVKDDPILPDGPDPVDPVGPSDTDNIQGAISAVVVGAAAGAIIYEAGTGIYRVINMPGIPMPSNRIELAELLWEHAGKPEPVSTALYSDIDEGDTDAQKAARWAVEQDLMKDDADNNKFHPAFPVSKLRTCLTWNAAKEKGLFDKTEE